jgi:hypothetical protein
MFNSRDFLRVEYNVLSKNVTRDVSQSEKTLSFNEIIEALDLWTMLLLIQYTTQKTKDRVTRAPLKTGLSSCTSEG